MDINQKKIKSIVIIKQYNTLNINLLSIKFLQFYNKVDESGRKNPQKDNFLPFINCFTLKNHKKGGSDGIVCECNGSNIFSTWVLLMGRV